MYGHRIENWYRCLYSLESKGEFCATENDAINMIFLFQALYDTQESRFCIVLYDSQFQLRRNFMMDI